MSLGRSLLDTAVFVYAVGVEHEYREACARLVLAASDGRYRGEASVLAMEELLHQRTRRTGDRPKAQQTVRNAAASCVIHDLTYADLLLGIRLFGDASRIGAADALHAATALNRGIPTIISPDHAFDDVTGLQRIDPIEAAGLL